MGKTELKIQIVTSGLWRPFPILINPRVEERCWLPLLPAYPRSTVALLVRMGNLTGIAPKPQSLSFVKRADWQWRIQDSPEGVPSVSFAQNCMKMKELNPGGHVLAAPLDPPVPFPTVF